MKLNISNGYIHPDDHARAVSEMQKEIHLLRTKLVATTKARDCLKVALNTVSDWKQHNPQLAIEHGSNGVRDHYRQVAKLAIMKELSLSKQHSPDQPHKPQPNGWPGLGSD